MIRQIRALAALSMFLLVSAQANATIVRFQMSDGNRFDVNLYDRRTPATVANFLAYVNAGAYTNVVMHRSVSGFVVQGGGYTYPGSLPLANIVERPAVTNEPLLSNVRGTIAMAKLSGSVNSATSQWFINMGNNSANLDVQNGGFTVFGEVTAGGMAVLDAINALPVFNSSPLDSLPLRNYTTGAAITSDNLVYATSVTVLDSNADSAASLTPVANTLLGQSGGGTTPPASDSGGGGATGAASLLLLGALALWRQLGRYGPTSTARAASRRAA
jgi:peptidyl-prolyl cis-trans isomerase A (cyclophilin A)